MSVSFGLMSCRAAGNHRSDKPEKRKKGELSESQQQLLENKFIDACKERLAERFESAENLLRQCLKLDPNNAPTKYELSQILKITGRLDEATLLAKECSEANPKNEWYHHAYIDCLHAKKQYLQAAEATEKLVKYFPDRTDFIESLAIEYAMARNYAKSFKIYEDLEKRFGTNETFTLNKIKLLKEQKKFGEAEAELKALLKSNPNEPRFYTYLAEYYEDVNDLESAKAVYEKLQGIDPSNPNVHLALANYYKEHNLHKEAHNELKMAFSNPDLDSKSKLNILIQYYSISEQYPDYTEKAYELCEIFLKVHPNSPESHSIYADFLLRDRKFEGARTHYFIAANYDKNRYGIWQQLLDVESDLKETDSLERHSQTAMDLFPNQPYPYYVNGQAHLALGNYSKAAEALKDGLEFVYDNKVLMLKFYLGLADAYHYLGEHEKSDKAFDDALKIDPDNASILNNYSNYLSSRKDKLEKAEKLSRRSNEIDQNKSDYISTYGWILYLQGRYKEAEEWLGRAAKLNAKNPIFLEQYGDVLYKLNRAEEALQHWKLAKDAGGNSEKLNKKIASKKLDD
jgi:tetratricopeptide (TPR) repeat protein